MSFLSGGIRGLKKLADPLGLVNKKNRIDLTNWKDPLTLFSDPKKGGGGPAAAANALGSRGNPGMDNSMQNAFMQQLPQMLGNQSMFARPEAAQFLAQSMGAQPPQWAGGPAQASAPPPGMLANANPFAAQQNSPWAQLMPGAEGGFVGGANPFAAAIQGQSPGPGTSMETLISRLRGTFGNGGGVTMPTSQRQMLSGGGRVGPRRLYQQYK